MLVAKILFNSIISTQGARFMMIDISNFYLITPLKRPEYIRMKIMIYPRKSSMNTNCKKKSTDRAWFVSKSQKGCMDYHRQDS